MALFGTEGCVRGTLLGYLLLKVGACLSPTFEISGVVVGNEYGRHFPFFNFAIHPLNFWCKFQPCIDWRFSIQFNFSETFLTHLRHKIIVQFWFFLFFAAWWKRWHTSFGVEQSHIQIYLYTMIYRCVCTYVYVCNTYTFNPTYYTYIYIYIRIYTYIYIFLHVIPYPYFTLTYRL